MIEVAADLDTATAICVFARLDDPERVAVLGELLQHLVVLRVVVGLHEFEELAIRLTLLDMKGERERVEGILAERLVVDLHVVVDGFLV